jgi:cellulose synthase/poly-beta-1,6-N-acetylglucosamine synthase-like glycosyltransferase
MNPGELPHVSVVVPTHAWPELLAACVAAVGRLRYPDGRLEIVVVDDGSPTPVDRDSFDDGGRPIRVVRPASGRSARSGPAKALQRERAARCRAGR